MSVKGRIRKSTSPYESNPLGSPDQSDLWVRLDVLLQLALKWSSNMSCRLWQKWFKTNFTNVPQHSFAFTQIILVIRKTWRWGASAVEASSTITICSSSCGGDLGEHRLINDIHLMRKPGISTCLRWNVWSSLGRSSPHCGNRQSPRCAEERIAGGGGPDNYSWKRWSVLTDHGFDAVYGLYYVDIGGDGTSFAHHGSLWSGSDRCKEIISLAYLLVNLMIYRQNHLDGFW